MGAFLLGIFGNVYARQSLTWARAPMSTAVTEDVVYLPGETALKMSALGYGPFASDLMFIRVHAYLLRHLEGDQILRWLDKYVDAVVTLDENNQEIYNWAATVVRYGQIIDDDVIARSNRFAEMGIERFPDDPRLYSHLGYNKYNELRPGYLQRERDLKADIGAAVKPRLPGTADRMFPALVRYHDTGLRARLLDRLAGVRNARYALERDALVDFTLSAMLPGTDTKPDFLVALYVKHDEERAAAMAASLYGKASSDGRYQIEARLRLLGHNELAEQLKGFAKKHKTEMVFIPEGLFQLIGSDDELRVPESWDQVGDIYTIGLRGIQERESKSP